MNLEDARSIEFFVFDSWIVDFGAKFENFQLYSYCFSHNFYFFFLSDRDITTDEVVFQRLVENS